MSGTEDIRLTQQEYEQLRQSTETHREELLVRLCGEVGLRAAEIPRVKPADVTSRGREGRTQYFLTVQEDEGTREAYIPSRVAHDFWQYVRSNAVNSTDPVIDVSPRRVQMLVSEVGERAAEATGRTILRSVTPSVLRRFFARQLLVENGIDPRIVTAVGGWEGVDALLPSTDRPSRGEVVAAFEHLSAHGDGSARPGRLTGVVRAVDRAGTAIDAAGSREAIEDAIPDALVEGRTYTAAWVTDLESLQERIAVRAHAGEGPDRFEGAGDSTLIRQAFRTERVLVAPDQPRPGVDHRGMLAAVPLVHGGTCYGVLVVKADSRGAFDDPERILLGDLGRRIGLSITATERRRLLLGDTAVRIALQYRDDDAVLVDLHRAMDRPVSLEGLVAGDDHSLVTFVRIPGIAGEVVLEWATETDGVGDARLVSDHGDDALLEMVITGSTPAVPITERGGSVQTLAVEEGRALLVAEFAPDVAVRPLVEEIRRRFPTVELHSKEEVTPTDRTPESFRDSVDQRLTEKQQSAIRAAYHAGYFEWPRESTAEELADSMDIASPTLHNHLRRAQQKLLRIAFDD